MRIVVPISTYFNVSTRFQSHLTALPQMLENGEGRGRLDAQSYKQLKSKKGQTVRLQPVSLDETLAQIEDDSLRGQTVLLIPTSNFDATPYNNIVQAITYRNQSLQTATLDGYGSALAYLTEGIVSYCQQHRPTAEQVTLFVDALQMHLHSFVVCPRSKIFEPTLNPFLAFAANLLRLPTVYGSDALAWKRSSIAHVGQTIKQQKLSNCQVWIDTHNGERTATKIIKQLKGWGLTEKQMTRNPLLHTSTSFPKRFALVTVAPNKQKVKALANWSLRWREPAQSSEAVYQ